MSPWARMKSKSYMDFLECTRAVFHSGASFTMKLSTPGHCLLGVAKLKSNQWASLILRQKMKQWNMNEQQTMAKGELEIVTIQWSH
jgi:predicted metal-binding protein